MINLIPGTAKKRVAHEYWVRVATAWFFLWSFALILGACVFIPAYVLINTQVSVYTESAKVAQETVDDYEKVSRDLTASGKQARVILEASDKTPIHKYVSLFESLQGPGITLSKISLARDDTGLSPVTLSGEASDRASLAAFRDRLLAEEVLKEVDLPISNLAKDSDIQFIITVTMANKIAL